MSLRSLERSVVKNRCIKENGNTKNFCNQWKAYHDKKIMVRTEQISKDGDTTTVRTKPTTRKKHFDDSRVFFKHMKMVKERFAEFRKKANNKNRKV